MDRGEKAVGGQGPWEGGGGFRAWGSFRGGGISYFMRGPLLGDIVAYLQRGKTATFGGINGANR